MITLERIKRWILFNLWYLGNPPWDTGISPPELLNYINTHVPGRAIDLGCGTGLNVLTLASAGWEVTGVDFAMQAVAEARRRIKKAGLQNVEIMRGDVTNLPRAFIDFDLVLDIGCYHGLSQSDKIQYQNNLTRILAQDGNWLVYGHVKTQDSDKIGFTENDFIDFSKRLNQVSRQEGHDRKDTGSVWLLFQRK